jgi:hypothetical protein
MKEYVVFNIEGGIGKAILGTALCQAFAEQMPEKSLIVVSGYPEVFLNNPYVHRSFSFSNIQYFFDEYIKDRNTQIFVHNPYNTSDYIYKRKHIIKIWCELFELKYTSEYHPQIFLTNREQEFFTKQINVDKPILLLQTNGGADNQVVKYSWARDIPISLAQKVVNYFISEYSIFHIRRNDQIPLENTFPITANFRELCVLASLSSKRLLMDSFLHHLCSSFRLKSSVLWIVNSPNVFGYDFNDNILANPFTNKPELRSSYLQEFNITGEPLEFPYNSEEEIFDIERVINSLTSH